MLLIGYFFHRTDSLVGEGEAARTKTGLWVYLSRQRPSLELTLGLLVRAGGLSAVNAIGTKLRETIYSASAKPPSWKAGGIQRCFRLGLDNAGVDAGRNGPTRIF